MQMTNQQNRDRELLKNWEAKLEKEFSPTGHIKGLEVQANNLIINFESEVPGQFQLTTGAPIRMVGELLSAQDRLTEERVRAEMAKKIGSMCGIPDAGDACRAILNYLSNQTKNES